MTSPKKLGAVADQVILWNKMDDFEHEVHQFKTIMGHFLDQNPDLKHFTDILFYYDEFKNNIDNYDLSKKRFIKTSNKTFRDDMIKCLWNSHRSLNGILKLVIERKKLGKLRILDSIRKRKIDILVDNMMRTIKDYIGYLKSIEFIPEKKQ